MIAAMGKLARKVGVQTACRTLGVPRSSYYRALAGGKRVARRKEKRRSPRALCPQERGEVRQVLNSPGFVDLAPREVYAGLLDEGRYLCHWRTMYRVLAEHGEVRERRSQRRHPVYPRPELAATAPNQLWSWDISKLLGPVK